MQSKSFLVKERLKGSFVDVRQDLEHSRVHWKLMVATGVNRTRETVERLRTHPRVGKRGDGVFASLLPTHTGFKNEMKEIDMPKKMVLLPIYWGEWWVPAQHNAFNWAEVNGMMMTVVGGRYMDGLNQYGIQRGYVSRTFVYPLDPPAFGFADNNIDWMLKTAIDQREVYRPGDFDLANEEPFYCLIVKPGIEHMEAQPSGDWTPDSGTGAYHSGFTYVDPDTGDTWNGQKCWVKGGSSAVETVQRWVHEMAEAYSAGAGEISDKCQSNSPILVDGISVPQYWSQSNNSCWPQADPLKVYATIPAEARNIVRVHP